MLCLFCAVVSFRWGLERPLAEDEVTKVGKAGRGTRSRNTRRYDTSQRGSRCCKMRLECMKTSNKTGFTRAVENPIYSLTVKRKKKRFLFQYTIELRGTTVPKMLVVPFFATASRCRTLSRVNHVPTPMARTCSNAQVRSGGPLL